MTPSQLRLREQLYDRMDTITARHHNSTNQEFIDEVISIAESLTALAQQADSIGGDSVERSRTWRYVGNAYQNLADAQDSGMEPLMQADIAFEKADALLDSHLNPLEQMKLDFAYSRVLMLLSQGSDASLVKRSHDRCSSALLLARIHMPGVVSGIEESLATIKQTLSILQDAANLDKRIEEHKDDLNSFTIPPSSAWPEDFQNLFRELKDGYANDVKSGKVSVSRQDALQPIMNKLASMLKSRPEDLKGKLNQSAQLSELADQMGGFLGKTAPGYLPADSRANALWQRFALLKTAVGMEMMKRASGSVTSDLNMELFVRCGHADTFIHQHAAEEQTIREHERDVLRSLALDARGFMQRERLMVARPIWPSSSTVQDPAGIFFSGGDQLHQRVSDACTSIGLCLLPIPSSHDYATARWEQLLKCNVAIFDFTDYARPLHGPATEPAVAGVMASISYELGVALTLGRPIIILAKEDQELPFDVDIHPLLLKGGGIDQARIEKALDDAIYSLPTRTDYSSLPATQACLRDIPLADGDYLSRQAVSMLDDTVAKDPILFKRIVDRFLAHTHTSTPCVIYPRWEATYPDISHPLLFHVAPFRPEWANYAKNIVAKACVDSCQKADYVRGDDPLNPDIIGTIWQAIGRSSHVLADLTGLNANVALEVGMAHALGRNTMLVSQSDDLAIHCPSISKLRIHKYSLDNSLPDEQLGWLVMRFLKSS
jgi:hypothetical protein